jgi:hypothetical protein
VALSRSKAGAAERRAVKKAALLAAEAGGVEVPPYAVSRAREAAARARLAELEVHARLEEYVPRAERDAIVDEAERYSVAVREHMLGVVERARAEVPEAGWPMVQMVAWLDRAVREALELAATQLAEDDEDEGDGETVAEAAP